ncbi:MAG: sigma-70 family RNA polymerase sigma factor [Blastocatellales bacterium]
MSKSDSEALKEVYLNGLIEQILPFLESVIRNSCLRCHHYPSSEDIERLSQRLILFLLENNCRRLLSFNNQSSLRTWLQTLANNYVIRQLQRERRAQSLNELSSDLFTIPPLQEEMVWQEERMKLLDKALNGLTKRERQLFNLFRSGRKAEKIAEITGIKLTSVYREKHSIMKKLRELLKNVGGGGRKNILIKRSRFCIQMYLKN